MKLIVNADDFGISLGANYGIVEAHKNGIVTSTTMMMNQYATDEAMELLKRYRTLGVGIHFCLTKGKPLCSDLKTLVNEKGEFYRDHEKIKDADIDEIRRELRAQFSKFISYNETPTHIDSHHHVHMLPNVLKVVEEIALEYKLPVRSIKAYGQNLDEKIKSNDCFGNFYGDDLTPENLMDIIEENKEGNTLEVMCHPAFLDDLIFYHSTYNIQRIREYAILTSSKIKEYIKDNNIELITYKEI